MAFVRKGNFKGNVDAVFVLFGVKIVIGERKGRAINGGFQVAAIFFFARIADRLGIGVDDGLHMKIFLDSVHQTLRDAMRRHKIQSAVHFHVRGEETVFRAVIVNDEVVHAINARLRFHIRLHLSIKRGVRLGADDGI